MRVSVLVFAMLCGACVSADKIGDFSPDQVWQLGGPEIADAQVIVGAVEPRRDRTVVHASIIGLSGPSSTSTFFDALARERGGALTEDAARHFIVTGMFDEKGEYSLQTADIGLSPDHRKSEIAVPHIAVYSEDLRQLVSGLPGQGQPLHWMFEDLLGLWRTSEARWPTLNEKELDRPFSERLGIIKRNVALRTTDPALLTGMGPPPPAIAEGDEIVIDAPALDARCREIVDPGPLDPTFVADLIADGFTSEEITGTDVNLSGITVTRSEKWGHIWRANAEDARQLTSSGATRPVCWRKNADDQPKVTFYPSR